MHISDGILSQEVVITTSVLAVASLAYSLKNLKNEDISLVAAMSALFFVASFIHIPIGPTQIHLTLIGIIGVLLGKRVFLSIFVALLLQAALLGYGGLTSLGANVIIMSYPAFIVYVLLQGKIFNIFNEKIKYFLIGFISILISTVFLALVLALSKEEYIYASYTVILANIPTMFIEGLITLFLLNYIKKAMPELLKEAKL